MTTVREAFTEQLKCAIPLNEKIIQVHLDRAAEQGLSEEHIEQYSAMLVPGRKTILFFKPLETDSATSQDSKIELVLVTTTDHELDNLEMDYVVDTRMELNLVPCLVPKSQGTGTSVATV